MKNLYHSTRNLNSYLSSHEAILKGIADDGGLYVFDAIDETPFQLDNMLNDSYFELAEKVLKKLLPDYKDSDILECVQNAYGNTFDSKEITPLQKVGEDYILELFHGPTSAFKDVGLQMLPQLMSKALAQEEKQKVMILTATSGDTGKAALEGFRDVDNVGITVFYPDQGVSDIQRLQMITQLGKNVNVCAIKGNFDDAQSQVKKLFASEELVVPFHKQNLNFSSANSINIGRLIPQVVYYFYAYIQMVKREEINVGDEVNFCVPTGNFGNVLAGYYAKMMGLPVHRFIVASNANNVLYDFLKNGVYDRNRPFHKTISPSMDILISSNLERLLYYMNHKDCDKVKELMDELTNQGHYEISKSLKEAIQKQFYGGYSNDEETRNAIEKVYKETGYVMDPHTAVGFKVMKEYQEQDKTPCILLSTASPYKFADKVYEAIYKEPLDKNEFEIMQELSKKTNTMIPAPLANLVNMEPRFHDCIEKDDMLAYVDKKTKEMLL